jgi:hypothetical protein
MAGRCDAASKFWKEQNKPWFLLSKLNAKMPISEKPGVNGRTA